MQGCGVGFQVADQGFVTGDFLRILRCFFEEGVRVYQGVVIRRIEARIFFHRRFFDLGIRLLYSLGCTGGLAAFSWRGGDRWRGCAVAGFFVVRTACALGVFALVAAAGHSQQKNK